MSVPSEKKFSRWVGAASEAAAILVRHVALAA
jgi:hypothetical protein